MLFYLHVPKTGGQSLTRRLASAFLADETHYFKEDLAHPKGVETLRLLAETKKFVESHVAGPLLKDVKDVDVLATIRNPVDQMVSNWLHMRREQSLMWHRAARQLTPAAFFDHFGDFFRDHQTGYLISAFVGGMRALARESGHYRAATQHLFPVVDRIRWLVPTESIDEFVGLWEIESRRIVPNKTESVNIAPEHGTDVAEARAALLARPHLYAVDRLLYEITKERFSQYKEEIHSAISPWRYPENSTRAHYSQGSGVWLIQNWHEPEEGKGGREWWFGPTNMGQLRIRRTDELSKLSFVVNVVNGISLKDIEIRARESRVKLPIEILPVGSRGGDKLSVDVSKLGVEADLTFTVPNCFPSIMTTQNDDSLVRRAFLASNWMLE
jgi:Sulfotransferase family